jgi:hypothetical protein
MENFDCSSSVPTRDSTREPIADGVLGLPGSHHLPLFVRLTKEFVVVLRPAELEELLQSGGRVGAIDLLQHTERILVIIFSFSV